MNPKSIAHIARQVNATLVMHQQFQEAYDGILELIHLNSLSDVSFGGVVIAPSGCGKSSLIKLVQQSLATDSRVPTGSMCLTVSAGANTSVGQLVSDLMKQLGYQTVVRTSTIADQSALLATTLKERKVVAVFIDESQHISRGRRTLSAAAITDWIKVLRDTAGIVIVMMGTREFIPLGDSNDQLASRAPATFTMSEFKHDASWSGLLLRIAQEVSSFDFMPVTTFTKQLHKMTNGVPRTLKQILIASAASGLKSKKTSLDQDCLKEGFHSVFGNSTDAENIFGPA